MAKRFTPLRLQIPKGAAYFTAMQQIAKGFGPPMGSGAVLVGYIPQEHPTPNTQVVSIIAPLGLSTGDVNYLRGAQAGMGALARLVQPVQLAPTDPATPKG